MRFFFGALLLTFFITNNSKAADNIICAMEASSYEHAVQYEDVIKFFSQQNIALDQIAFPDVYVFAYSWLNTPYRYGGNSRNGIDCSRFVMRVFNEVLGLNTVGTSRQIYEQGNKIDKSQLKEGDLVFFKTRGNTISHVGIYLQNNKFVHSSSSKGVVISSLNEPYWSRTYYKSARFFEPNPF